MPNPTFPLTMPVGALITGEISVLLVSVSTPILVTPSVMPKPEIVVGFDVMPDHATLPPVISDIKA